MKRFIEGEDRNQSTLSLECLEDYIAEDNLAGSLMYLLMNLISANWASGVLSQK